MTQRGEEQKLLRCEYGEKWRTRINWMDSNP